jgi:hypothetical protein
MPRDPADSRRRTTLKRAWEAARLSQSCKISMSDAFVASKQHRVVSRERQEVKRISYELIQDVRVDLLSAISDDLVDVGQRKFESSAILHDLPITRKSPETARPQRLGMPPAACSGPSCSSWKTSKGNGPCLFGVVPGQRLAGRGRKHRGDLLRGPLDS